MDELCGDYQRGRCLRGASCRYRHVGEIPQRAPGEAEEDERDMECRDYQRGRCVRGEQCRFKHVGEIDQSAPPETGILDSKGTVINLPSRGYFAAPPKAAEELAVPDETPEGPSTAPSEILGVSELDICRMTPEELIVLVERKIRAAMAVERAHDVKVSGQADAEPDPGDDEDLPPLPPLPPASTPTFCRGVAVREVHDSITELVRELATSGNDSGVRDVIRDDLAEDLALAMFQVMHESGVLRDAHGTLQALPQVAAPALPPGCKSWIVLESTEEKAQRLRREREERMQMQKRKRKREDEYRRWEKEQKARKRKEERQQQQRRRALARLRADQTLDPHRKQRLEQELQDFGVDDIEEILKLEEDELQDLDTEDSERIRTLQKLLRNARGGDE